MQNNGLGHKLKKHPKARAWVQGNSPDCTILREGHAVLGQQLGGDDAQGTQQSPASVDQLDGPVAGKGVLQAQAEWRGVMSTVSA
eukprot:1154926-Pelagomonas_calceolata.AAC.3